MENHEYILSTSRALNITRVLNNFSELSVIPTRVSDVFKSGAGKTITLLGKQNNELSTFGGFFFVFRFLFCLF